MPCYRPMTAWRSASGRLPNGGWPIVFDLSSGIKSTEMKIPCGQCIGCRLERAREWACRCEHEMQMHVNNCMITLTYNDDNLRYSVDKRTGEMLPTLTKDDYKLFMKRLRKQYGEGIRFIQCGEYGEDKGRPHHHAILFNHDFHDRYFFKNSKSGIPIYRSFELENLWEYGDSGIQNASWDAAAYIAGYVTKKVNGIKAEDHYAGRLPEFITMSRNPGIGKKWMDKYGKSDLWQNDNMVCRGGKISKPAKYYDKKLSEIDPDDLQKRKEIRLQKARDSPQQHRTRKRLKVREIVKKINFNRRARDYENVQHL